MGAAVGLGGDLDLQDDFMDVVGDLVAVDPELDVERRLGLPLEYLGRRRALDRQILDILGDRRRLRAFGGALAIALWGRVDRILVGHGISLENREG